MTDSELKSLIEKNIKLGKDDDRNAWFGRFVYPSGSIYTSWECPNVKANTAKANIKRSMITQIIKTAAERCEDLSTLKNRK